MRNDGSVVVIRANSRSVSGRLLAEYIKLNRDKNLAVLTGREGSLFDEALESVDESRSGFQKMSNWRPAHQVLPLALGLLWKPMDPSVLLQFLTHPIGPLPWRVCRRLAPVVVDSPGIGGSQWQKTITEIIGSDETGSKTDEKKLKALKEKIDYWLHPPRSDSTEGIPTTVAAGRCQKVAEWLGGLIGVSDDQNTQTLYGSSQGQAADLLFALDELSQQGKDHINKQQLESLLDHVSGPGSPMADKCEESQHVAVTDNPGAFTKKVDRVIWWFWGHPIKI